MSVHKPSLEKLEKQLRVLKKKLERSEQHRVDLENQHDRDQHLYRRLHAELEAARREAQIEAALERVRARAMAMHESDELLDVIFKIHQQFAGLGLPCGAFWHTRYTPEYYHKALTGIDGEKLAAIMELPRDFSSNPALAAWERGDEEIGVFKFDAAAACQYHYHMVTKGKFFEVDPEAITEEMIRENDGWTFVQARTSHGEIGYSLWGETEPSQEAKDILVRFARTFDLAYRRFLDLQQAEARAREAQVEAALERVRARAMAMHRSDELAETAAVVHEQLRLLGFDPQQCGFDLIDGETLAVTSWVTNADGKFLLVPGEYADNVAGAHAVADAMLDAWQRGEPGYSITLEGEALRAYEDVVTHHLRIPRDEWGRVRQEMSDRVTINHFHFSHGILFVRTLNPLTPEQHEIGRRFAGVFELAYRRFLDLKQAEAQARKAQVEASLERVRARAMAMHSSDDLSDATAIVFTELERLGLHILRCGINIIHDSGVMDLWTATATSEDSDLRVLGRLDTSMHPMLNALYGAWKAQQLYFTYTLAGEDMQSYYRALREAPDYAFPEDANPTESHVAYLFFFPEGGLFAFSHQPLTEDAIQIFKRFAGVFALTYRRYLDLKQAEEQAREAQIEAALERVRARTMAMQKSEELSETSALLFAEIRELGIETWTSGFNIWEDDERACIGYNATPAGGLGVPIRLPLTEDLFFRTIYEAKKRGDEFLVFESEGESLAETYRYMFTLPVVKDVMQGIVDEGYNLPTYQTTHCGFFSHGHLMFITLEPCPEAWDIFKRFTKVFEQTYTRFLDLKKSEEQAQQARRQASLDRVRAEIASMRTADDLQHITPLIWRELTTLGVPFFRCGVFVIDEADEAMQVYLTNPEGKALAVLRLGFDDAPLVEAAVAHWRQEAVYTEEWDAAEMREWTTFLQTRGLITEPTRYLDAEAPPEHLALHFVPFEQGMLYVGSRAPLRAETLDIVQALADTFAVAYARYEDFQRLEAAKAKLEATLVDLKAAQQQLIHAEKMASLGALTAGIAHEIKNPLNFINNFAEINEELADELREDLADHPDALAAIEDLLADLRQNAAVIAQHGKRADGIVRSMMQHARGGEGRREAIDLNTVVAEYVDLAFHGKRAQVPGFNAEIEKDLDAGAGSIAVVPQEIGRVLLNLIGNAFDAVDEHATRVNGRYVPTVTVSTRHVDGHVEITVKDNGPGIPAEIREKIFEPFFTTKPTGTGTGLGLSLSYDIVTQGHGGAMTVESEEGEGATFIFTLPQGN